MKISITVLLVLFCTLLSFAQDKIYKKDKSIIECTIKEIGINEIKYRLPEGELEDSPIISISVTEVLKVVLSSGRVVEFKDPLTDPSSYAEDKKHALKIHFLSPLFEHTAFSYEKSIRPGRSFEAEFGIIGLGFDSNELEKSSGIFLSSGYKFMKTPDFYSSRYKYAHILKGSYVKPQIALSFYNNEYESFSSSGIETKDQSIVAGALLINLGKQIIYDDFFLIDYSFGIGYGFSNQGSQNFAEEENFRNNHFGFIMGDSDIPIAITARLKIGILL